MLRKLLVVALLIGIVGLAGCVTKPISYLEAAATEIIHPDGPISSFLAYGPGSAEFADSIDHFEAHRRTYEKDLKSLIRDWDKYFLRYDVMDPFAE